MNFLHILTGEHHGAEIPLSGTVTMGSSDQADIQLLDTVRPSIRLTPGGDDLTITSDTDFQWIGSDRTLGVGREITITRFCLLCIDGVYCYIHAQGEPLDCCVEDVVAWFVHGTVPRGFEPEAAAAEPGPESVTEPEEPQTPPPGARERLAARVTQAGALWASCPALARRNLALIGAGTTMALLVFLASLLFVLKLSSQDNDLSKIVSFLNISKSDMPGRPRTDQKMSLNDAVVASETKQLHGELLSELEKYSLRDYISFHLEPQPDHGKTMMLFNFSGNLTQHEDDLLQSLLQTVKSRYDNLKINGKITIFKESPPSNISQIIYGQKPRIVDRQGKIYAVGDAIEGKKILAISRSQVMFRGKRDMVLTW